MMRRPRRWTQIGAGLVVVGAWASASATLRAEDAGATCTLAVVRAKGDTWKVEQTLDLASKNKGVTTFAGGMGHAASLVKGDVELVEKWTDTCADAADGAATEVKRAIAISKIKAQKSHAGSTTLQGVTIRLRPNAEGLAVEVEKGKPPELAVKLLERGPIDPVELLLPKDPVAVGQEWEISVEDLTRFQALICVGAAGAKGDARESIALLLETLGEGSPASAGKIVKGHVEAVKGHTATVVFVGDASTDELTAKGIDGPLFKQPPTTTTIEGTLTFDLGKGRPLHLTWKQVHDQGDAEPGPNVPVKIPGFTETWNLEKTWK